MKKCDKQGRKFRTILFEISPYRFIYCRRTLNVLIANAVNDKIFTVVDRAQLEQIRMELNFQVSGEVDDKSALEIGKFLGAQTIVSGVISELGDTVPAGGLIFYDKGNNTGGWRYMEAAQQGHNDRQNR